MTRAFGEFTDSSVGLSNVALIVLVILDVCVFTRFTFRLVACVAPWSVDVFVSLNTET